MTNRILDFSNSPAHLHARGGTLEIKLPENQIHSVAFEDIASVIVSHPQVTISQSALARLSSAGAVLVITNEKYMPVAMTMPIESHWYQADRFVRQAAMASPKKKRIWQQIVREKIVNQSKVLIAERGADLGLLPMSRLVLSGDTGNVEARAARSYWPKLFNDKTFFRSNEEDPRNGLLNYGYAVLRAAVARSISAAGLHPSFGLHHVNKLNAYPLADDLMEPFRPLVDAQVLRICKDTSLALELLPPTKQALLQILASRFSSNGEQRSLFDILGRMAQSLASVILERNAKFEIGLDSPFPVLEEN
jgi:CRISPR-associated protein Cas1